MGARMNEGKSASEETTELTQAGNEDDPSYLGMLSALYVSPQITFFDLDLYLPDFLQYPHLVSYGSFLHRFSTSNGILL
jgi:hypothetical protein